MTRGSKWIEKRANASLNPAQVQAALSQLSEKWPSSAPAIVDLIDKFPLGPEALIHLIAASSICATRLVRRPEILSWLSEPDTCRGYRDRAQMFDLFASIAESNPGDEFRALRVWKGQEMVRIALREIAETASLEETTAELSQIAEICVRRVFDHWNAELRQRYGSPASEFAILALGKLGGRELNHSSDVDLIFLYSSEGNLSANFSYHEFFNRLAEKIFDTFARIDPEGSLFRVDLRLRPEGSAGPLARSLDSMEYYYSGFGETWERLALIKARGIAGGHELVYEFLRRHQPFIYPKNPTPDLLEQVANIKRRIERDVVGEEKLHRNVKLGRGGIREIEFIVQTLQFIHGARHAFLQETSTLKALRALAELELIPQDEIVDLDRAYRFLRKVEHRLQIEAEQQIHTVPDNADELRRLSQSLGFSSADEFSAALEREMTNVRAIFDHLISQVPSGKETERTLEIFADRTRAERALIELGQGQHGAHISPRTRQVFRRLRPQLFDALTEVADPDATLNQFVRFVQAYGLRSLLFELLVANPRLLELVIKTLDASRFAGDLLVRHPQLLEEITLPGKLDPKIDVAGHLHELQSFGKTTGALERIRAYRQTQLLRIVLRDVLGLADLSSICAELTALAEACLIFVNEILGGASMTIVAMGKFGGAEISYGADLDVLFVGDESGPAQRLLSTIAQPSAEGNLSPVDARLRPEGEKGPLVCSLQTFEQYYANRAQLWEIQALTRARPIGGPFQSEFIEITKRVWSRAGQDADLKSKIDNMLERIRRERGSGDDFLNFKTGSGGIIEAEFLAQGLQMREGIWEPNWTRAIDRLRHHIPEKEALKQAYGLLRRCESVLRRYENTNVSALPADSAKQEIFSRRMGFAKIDIFAEQYRTARSLIHQSYERLMKN